MFLPKLKHAFEFKLSTLMVFGYRLYIGPKDFLFLKKMKGFNDLYQLYFYIIDLVKVLFGKLPSFSNLLRQGYVTCEDQSLTIAE